jgi:hypothetical protein
MRFLLLLIRDVGAPRETPSAESLVAMGKYAETLARAGALLALDSLHEPDRGARVSFRAGRTEVVDGPQLEPSGAVGAYWLLQVKSKEEAVEWARRCPCGDGRSIEVRRVVELSDFPPEVRAAAKNG